LDEEFSSDNIRSSNEVAVRTLALLGAVATALGADRNEISGWLEQFGLTSALTEREKGFLAAAAPSERDLIDFSWQSERIVVLAWALGLADMPALDEQCDTAIFLDILPPYSDVPADEFVRSARLRAESELWKAAEDLLGAHWHARHAKLNSLPAPDGIDLGIVQERHHAINWVMGYQGLSWDEVTTDT